VPKELEIQRALSRRLRELDPDLQPEQQPLPAPVPMPEQKRSRFFPSISGKQVPRSADDLPPPRPMPIIGTRG